MPLLLWKGAPTSPWLLCSPTPLCSGCPYPAQFLQLLLRQGPPHSACVAAVAPDWSPLSPCLYATTYCSSAALLQCTLMSPQLLGMAFKVSPLIPTHVSGSPPAAMPKLPTAKFLPVLFPLPGILFLPFLAWPLKSPLLQEGPDPPINGRGELKGSSTHTLSPPGLYGGEGWEEVPRAQKSRQA